MMLNLLLYHGNRAVALTPETSTVHEWSNSSSFLFFYHMRSYVVFLRYHSFFVVFFSTQTSKIVDFIYIAAAATFCLIHNCTILYCMPRLSSYNIIELCRLPAAEVTRFRTVRRPDFFFVATLYL